MSQVQSKSRIPELDGIRGLAILSVLCFHYISMEGVTPAGSITDRLQRLVILGGTGVDLFFVLSGFLIGGILLDVKESPRYFSTLLCAPFFPDYSRLFRLDYCVHPCCCISLWTLRAMP